MAGATPYFELHILPMFRLTDMAHMRSYGDLSDYDFVKAEAPTILGHLKADMPTPESGGLWPDGWVATFEQWTKTGFSRLQLTSGTYTAVKRSNNSVRMQASIALPNANDAAWLQRLSPGNDPAEFIVYYRAGSGGGGTTVVVAETFPAPGPSAIYVTDKNGRAQVPIT